MSDDLRIVQEGRVGRIRLEPPQEIHALTQAMCAAMAVALRAWRSDPAIELVLIDHAEGRGFCAGGDIRALWESGRTDGVAAAAFFHAEYRLNHLLFTYPKPIVAIMDGITMGGGVGISQPARWRIATERTAFAMPETGIGLFPDVGGGWYLSRLAGEMGTYLATTGARIDGADCVALGLATHFVPSAALADLTDALIADPVAGAALLDAAAVPPPASTVAARRGDIDRLFAARRHEDIIEALAADASEFAAATRMALAAKSPQAVKVALRLLAESRRLSDFADEMRMEYRLATRICRRHDFIEGVRALIIDKTNDARWNPEYPEGVSDAAVDAFFAPLPAGEDWSPYPL